MSLHRGQLRTLYGIERDLADSDPDLDALFVAFASATGRPEMPDAEHISTRRLKVLSRLRRRRTLSERVKQWWHRTGTLRDDQPA